MPNPTTPTADTNGDELRRDISDIIEFPQYPKGRISTRDLRGQPMSSTELGYKVSLIMERVKAREQEVETRGQFALCQKLIEKNMHDGVINWGALGGDVANTKIKLLHQLSKHNKKVL